MIDLKNRIIFIHIPKTAGTSIEKYFLKIRGLNESDRAALALFKNEKNSNLERGNQHNSLKIYEDYYFGGDIPDDFRVFSVVRNPYSRFWSEWSSRKLPPPMRFPFSFYLSVNVLIRLAKRPVPALKDLESHMRPQSNYLEGRSCGRVRILHMESLAEEFSSLCSDWGLPNEPLELSNSSKRSNKPTEKDRVKGDEFVRDFYVDDFNKLGYDRGP